MDTSVHPHPDPLSRSAAAAARRACASRMRVNPACVARPPAADAAHLKPKRPRSGAGDEIPVPPSAKRLRFGEEPPRSPRRPSMPLAERDGVNDLLLSLVQPGSGESSDSCSDRVLPLPDSLVSFLQANQTGRGGGEDEIEIDVYDLGDDALHGIKTRITKYKQAPDAALPTLGSRQQGALSVREALAEVRPAMETIRRRGIERRRAEARRQVELVVRTVEFNDPFLDPQDVLK